MVYLKTISYTGLTCPKKKQKQDHAHVDHNQLFRPPFTI